MTTIDESLFDLLRETLPVSAGVWAAKYNANKEDFVDLSVQDVHPYIAWLEASKSFGIPTPPLLTNPRLDPCVQRLWTFEHDAADPATVSSIWCRVNGAGFVSHKVLERLEWGYEDMASGIFEKAVVITTTEGKEFKLPLTPEFVHTKLLVTDGYLPEGENPLWPLEMRLDRGMVIALVYEIGLDNVVAPWRDPDAASRSAYEAALKEVAAHSKIHPCVEAPKTRPKPPHAPPEVSDPNYTFVSARPQEGFGYPEDWPEPTEDNQCAASPWGAEISRGKLMPKSAAHGAVAGQVPATACVAVSPMKVLIVLSLATCRERSDYEPGGIVGMARLYPHILVRADVDLLKTEATVRYDRPDKTTRVEPTDGIEGEATSCCKKYDHASQEISSTLVADDNDNPQYSLRGLVPSVTFWGNIFGYYQTDAYQTLGQERIKVVCTDKRESRVDDSGLVERDVVLGFDSKTLTKMPYQGEFDNIHMAPKLRVTDVTHFSYIEVKMPEDLQDQYRLIAADAEKLHLDDVTMAPFCAHDCFHMHWRWGLSASAKWARGWDTASAHQVAGAPLVPLNQDVYIWLRGAAKLSVHHVIGRSDGSVKPLQANEWQVAMYQGTAYGVKVEGWFKSFLNETAYYALAAPPYFYDASVLINGLPKPITVSESTALFYWYSRWHAARPFGKTWDIVERLRTDPARLAVARAL